MKEEAEKREAKPEVKKASNKKEVEEEDDKREHVNIIFIGHVGKSFVCSITLLFLWNMNIIIRNGSKLSLSFFSRCWKINNWWSCYVSYSVSVVSRHLSLVFCFPSSQQ